jgi:hypothetical protein
MTRGLIAGRKYSNMSVVHHCFVKTCMGRYPRWLETVSSVHNLTLRLAILTRIWTLIYKYIALVVCSLQFLRLVFYTLLIPPIRATSPAYLIPISDYTSKSDKYRLSRIKPYLNKKTLYFASHSMIVDISVQDVPGGKFSILGGHSISHSMIYSERFPR